MVAVMGMRGGYVILNSAQVRVQHGKFSPSGNIKLCGLYFYYRFFSSEDRLADFLDGVTGIQVDRLSTPEAVNCPAK